MDISKLTITPKLNLDTSVTSVLKSLQPGQQLQANVVADSSQNLVKLKIGVTEFVARTQVSLRADQKITMEVIKSGELPELRLVRQPLVQDYQTDVLRSLLPKQLPMQRLFANLQAVYTNILRSLPLPGVDPKTAPNITPGQPQPTITTATATTTTEATTPIATPKISGADKEMLQLLQNLTGKSASQPVIPERIGPNLVQAARNILAAAIPNSNNITPTQLRQAMLGYGLFMEAQLAAGKPPDASFKGDLLQILFQIDNILKADKQQLPIQQAATNQSTTMQMESGFIKLLEVLFRHAEGSLARVHLNQLASLPSDDSSRQIWQFEIPVRHQEHVDSFLIRLEQEQAKRSGDDAKPIWYVTLNFNIDPLGPVTAKISMRDEEVSTMFLAERSESAELLNQRMTELGQAFTDAGLSVGQLFARHGKTEPEEPRHTPSTQLLDEKA